MAQQDVLQEFLVSLGFKIQGQQDFERRVDGTTVVVEKLGLAAMAAAAAVSTAFIKISDQLEQLYFASQRTGASVENIKAFSYAVTQMGGSAQGARDAIEGLARFMRNSPGGEGLMHSIGVQTRESNGALRDTETILDDLGKTFRGMPYYRANAYAGLLGIDEKTLQAMIRGIGDYSQRYRDLLSAVGLNTEEAARASNQFWTGLREIGSIMEVLAMKTVGRLEDAMLDLVGWFQGLDANGKLVIESLGGIAAAMVVLNSTFLRSPVGIILSLGTALLTLYDDYKTWREGGQSLIDWGKWQPEIEMASKAVEKLGSLLTSTYQKMQDLARSHLGGTGFWDTVGAVVTRGMAAMGNKEAIDAWNAMHPHEQISASGGKMPRNERNNNPGNLMFHGQPGARRGADDFAVFDTPENGMAAFSRQLQLYGAKGNDTVAGIINTYNPPHAKGNSPRITANYISRVAGFLGVDPYAHLDMRNAAVRANTMTAMIGVEGGGRNHYTDAQIAAGAAVTLSQTNNITVNGGGDGASVGAHVGVAVNDSNARLVRELRSAVQ
ncbi:MAG: hypothetical protein KGH75_02460 [Rhodospirillales bacterium]|nr:hypothetical protein [Rhodospirillales bacterium]